MNVARYMDHAVLKPDMTREQVREAIQMGIDYHVYSVCVRGCDIETALAVSYTHLAQNRRRSASG